MKKKAVATILIISVIIFTIIGVLMFTGIGREIRSFIYYKIHTPQEIVSLDKQEHIKVTYTYSWQEENFSIDVTDTELIKLIENNISNKKLDNYSSQIRLAIMGEYNVELGNDISFMFDSYDDDGFVIMKDKDKQFLTKINPEILKRIIEIVDVKLTENIQIFKTDKITATKRIMQENKASVINEYKVDIEEKTAINYILEQCKNVYTEVINYELSIVSPDYELDFNNNVKLLIYEENQEGFMIKDGFLLRAYGLNSFDTILENTFDDLETKKQMFTGDKITIKSPQKSIEITDKDTIEKIATPLMFSKIYRPNWIENYNITEEYNTGIKININENEFLIPGIKSIGNRYVITKDNKISLCFPLNDIEKYINELLGIKEEKYTGLISIGI